MSPSWGWCDRAMELCQCTSVSSYGRRCARRAANRVASSFIELIDARHDGGVVHPKEAVYACEARRRPRRAAAAGGDDYFVERVAARRKLDGGCGSVLLAGFIWERRYDSCGPGPGVTDCDGSRRGARGEKRDRTGNGSRGKMDRRLSRRRGVHESPDSLSSSICHLRLEQHPLRLPITQMLSSLVALPLLRARRDTLPLHRPATLTAS